MDLRLAHEVAINIIIDAKENLSRAATKKGASSFATGMFTGRIMAGIYMLRHMVIPQKHLVEVTEKLRSIEMPKAMIVEAINVNEVADHIIGDNAAHEAAKADPGKETAVKPAAQDKTQAASPISGLGGRYV